MGKTKGEFNAFPSSLIPPPSSLALFRLDAGGFRRLLPFRDLRLDVDRVLLYGVADGVGAAIDQRLVVGGVVQRLRQRAVQPLGDRTRHPGRSDQAESAADHEAGEAGI